MDYLTELKKYLSVKAVGKTAYLDLTPDDEPFRAGGELYTLIYCDKGEIKIEGDDFSVVTPESNLIVAASGKEIAMSATKKKSENPYRRNRLQTKVKRGRIFFGKKSYAFRRSVAC